MKSNCWIVTVLFVAVPTAFAGPDWDTDLKEDAGSTLQTAQTITVGGPVQTVAGRLNGTALSGGDFQDVYKIVISQPGKFLVDLTGSNAVNFDACLWLFDANGIPLLGTNDANANTTAPLLTNSSNAGSQITLSEPGVYFLAISGIGTQPLGLETPLWPSIVFQPGIVAGAFGTKFGWDGQWDGDGATGDYVMSLTGVSGVPAPGAIALLAMCAGLTGISGRRRRH